MFRSPFVDLQAMVNANHHRFSETERDILAFMLEHEEAVAEATISSLAHQTFTSTSSIVRLTKKLGFSGFAELKYFIKNSLTHRPQRIHDFVQAGKNDIVNTLNDLAEQELTEILKLFYHSRTLYCFGTGYAQRTAIQEFAKSMLACGKFTHVIPARNEFAGSTSVMNTDDVVVLVSLSGNTDSVKETIEYLALRKIPLIAITATGVNYMAGLADYSLTYHSTPTYLETSKNPYHSFVALNVLLDYLVRQYINFLEERSAS